MFTGGGGGPLDLTPIFVLNVLKCFKIVELYEMFSLLGRGLYPLHPLLGNVEHVCSLFNISMTRKKMFFFLISLQAWLPLE